MRILYLDCFSGISGDMFVGALCDLGVEVGTLRAELGKLSCAGEFDIELRRERRGALEGAKFEVIPIEAHRHGHGHHEHGGHGHEAHGGEGGHGHRGFDEIRGMIQGAALSEFVKERAVSVFRRIAEAEGRAHGMSPEEVHFHEVGALDSIADIVAACVAIEALGVDDIWASEPQEGRGFVECAHGALPVPVPAVVEILKGVPFTQTDEPHELITPTGAALYAEFVSRVTPWRGLRVERVGYGLGTRELRSRPNVLRAALAVPDSAAEHDEVSILESNLDDCPPEVVGDAMGRLFEAGALDVYAAPVSMKKSRPGVLLGVLCRPEDAARLGEMVLRLTTAFGVRETRASRRVLRREWIDVATPYGDVSVKIGFLGAERVQAAPEYESCRKVAEASGAPLRAVWEAALAAARG
ncbi:MAG TPA: nickel pincer cofactor biosynthesis protein LarC [Verrucomicrobiae bacterium]|nr:nickel pincer cofactor biosynthesis protein LarC [Verrucomicrobiae bacterium]